VTKHEGHGASNECSTSGNGNNTNIPTTRQVLGTNATAWLARQATNMVATNNHLQLPTTTRLWGANSSTATIPTTPNTTQTTLNITNSNSTTITTRWL